MLLIYDVRANFNYCRDLSSSFETIDQNRKILLEKISDYISKILKSRKEVNLVYICTHNSRRSHFGQIWAKVANVYYNIPHVNTFSGGTEATAFNGNAIKALERVGFDIKANNNEKNPSYHVMYDESLPPILCFSKTYDDANNPKKEFAAIMTCSDAEENCPFIPGVDLRIGTTYDDPKAFDNTSSLQDSKYDERCK
ncbi:MAG: protein-tyrosine-phosphatase [Sphingobacteriaceae bacterium]|nr:protein-tyrosine-phosphatase [Sphingobacteriaceae bacterium]